MNKQNNKRNRQRIKGFACKIARILQSPQLPQTCCYQKDKLTSNPSKAE